MPQALTQQFGPVEYRDEDAIEFPMGLPAFEEERLFLAIEREQTKPLVYLQSLGRADLCFIALPLLVVDPAYKLAVSAEDLRVLGLADFSERGTQPVIGKDVEALAIMSVTNSRPTANLLAPVLIARSGGAESQPSASGIPESAKGSALRTADEPEQLGAEPVLRSVGNESAKGSASDPVLRGVGNESAKGSASDPVLRGVGNESAKGSALRTADEPERLGADPVLRGSRRTGIQAIRADKRYSHEQIWGVSA